MDRERNHFGFREFRKVGGWAVVDEKQRGETQKGRREDQGQTCQQSPQPACTATWEDLKHMNACVPPPEILV